MKVNTVAVLRQIVEAFEHLDINSMAGADLGEGSVLDLPDVRFDAESETVSLSYGAGHNTAVYSVSVRRVQ